MLTVVDLSLLNLDYDSSSLLPAVFACYSFHASTSGLETYIWFAYGGVPVNLTFASFSYKSFLSIERIENRHETSVVQHLFIF